MTITTERCILRAPEARDRDQLIALSLDPEVRRYLGGPVPLYRAEQRANHLISGISAKHCRAVERIDEVGGHCVGIIHLALHHDGVYDELSYEFMPQMWGKGLATETLKAVIAHAAGKLNYSRLVSETQTANLPSRRLLERLGMTPQDSVERFGQLQVIYSLALR